MIPRAWQILYFYLRPFVAVKKRDPRAGVFGGLKLFGHLVGGERIVDAITAIAQLLNLLERVSATLLFGNDNIDVELVLLFGCCFQFLAGRETITKHVAKDHITHD